jgi:hypothetical protein
VLETVGLPIEDLAYMRATRDVSATRRAMIFDGCMEGGSDA